MFDMVNPNLLLTKLYRIGVRGVPNEWISSYLSNRHQQVVIENHYRSYKMLIESGSLLGLLPMIIFMNNIKVSCPENLKELVESCNGASKEFLSFYSRIDLSAKMN